MSKRSSDMLAAVLDGGMAKDGEVVRYSLRGGKGNGRRVAMVGRLHADGIEVAGVPQRLLLSAFEAHAGSRNRRPAEHTHLVSGLSVQQALAGLQGSAGGGAAHRTLQAGSGGVAELPVGANGVDHNDEVCHACGLGGDLLCCDACPAVFHPSCLGQSAQDLPEGDWFCPACIADPSGRGASKDLFSATFPLLSNRAQIKPRNALGQTMPCLSLRETLREESGALDGGAATTTPCQGIAAAHLDWRGWHRCLQHAAGLPRPHALFALADEGPVPVAMLQGGCQLSVQAIHPTAKAHDGLRRAALVILESGYGGVIFARSPQITLANAAGVSAIVPEVTAHILVGLWADGSLVSCACVRWVHDSLAEIPFMAVRAEVRAQGLGSVLAAAAEKMLGWPGALAVHHVLMPAMTRPVPDPSGSRPPAAPLLAAPSPSVDAAIAYPRALQETWGYALAPPAALAALCQARWLRFLGVCMCVKRPDASCGEPAQPDALALAALRKLPPCLKLLPGTHLHAASRAGHVTATGAGHAGMLQAGPGMQAALA